MIKRFDVVMGCSEEGIYEEECDTGEYVRYDDHAAEVERLEAEHKEKLERARDYARAAADFSVPFRTHGRGRWTDTIELLQEEVEDANQD